jgi:putative transposase
VSQAEASASACQPADRERQPAATAPNALWSMEFVSDALFDGHRLRALTVVDAFTREALAIEADQGIKGDQVVAVMTRLALIRGAPAPSGSTTGGSSSRRRSTAGPTRTASLLTSAGPASRPTMPLSNPSTGDYAMNASMHTGSCRWPTQSKIEAWRRHYNESPHTALGWLTPQEFTLAAAQQAAE